MRTNDSPIFHQINALAHAASGSHWTTTTHGDIVQKNRPPSFFERLTNKARTENLGVEYALMRLLATGASSNLFADPSDLERIQKAVRHVGLIQGNPNSEKSHPELKAIVDLIAATIQNPARQSSDDEKSYQDQAAKFYTKNRSRLKALFPPPKPVEIKPPANDQLIVHPEKKGFFSRFKMPTFGFGKLKFFKTPKNEPKAPTVQPQSPKPHPELTPEPTKPQNDVAPKASPSPTAQKEIPQTPAKESPRPVLTEPVAPSDTTVQPPKEQPAAEAPVMTGDSTQTPTVAVPVVAEPPLSVPSVSTPSSPNEPSADVNAPRLPILEAAPMLFEAAKPTEPVTIASPKTTPLTTPQKLLPVASKARTISFVSLGVIAALSAVIGLHRYMNSVSSDVSDSLPEYAPPMNSDPFSLPPAFTSLGTAGDSLNLSNIISEDGATTPPAPNVFYDQPNLNPPISTQTPPKADDEAAGIPDLPPSSTEVSSTVEPEAKISEGSEQPVPDVQKMAEEPVQPPSPANPVESTESKESESPQNAEEKKVPNEEKSDRDVPSASNPPANPEITSTENSSFEYHPPEIPSNTYSLSTWIGILTSIGIAGILSRWPKGKNQTGGASFSAKPSHDGKKPPKSNSTPPKGTADGETGGAKTNGHPVAVPAVVKVTAAVVTGSAAPLPPPLDAPPPATTAATPTLSLEQPPAADDASSTEDNDKIILAKVLNDSWIRELKTACETDINAAAVTFETKFDGQTSNLSNIVSPDIFWTSCTSIIAHINAANPAQMKQYRPAWEAIQRLVPRYVASLKEDLTTCEAAQPSAEESEATKKAKEQYETALEYQRDFDKYYLTFCATYPSKDDRKTDGGGDGDVKEDGPPTEPKMLPAAASVSTAADPSGGKGGGASTAAASLTSEFSELEFEAFQKMLISKVSDHGPIKHLINNGKAIDVLVDRLLVQRFVTDAIASKGNSDKQKNVFKGVLNPAQLANDGLDPKAPKISGFEKTIHTFFAQVALVFQQLAKHSNDEQAGFSVAMSKLMHTVDQFIAVITALNDADPKLYLSKELKALKEKEGYGQVKPTIEKLWKRAVDIRSAYQGFLTSMFPSVVIRAPSPEPATAAAAATKPAIWEQKALKKRKDGRPGPGEEDSSYAAKAAKAIAKSQKPSPQSAGALVPTNVAAANG